MIAVLAMICAAGMAPQDCQPDNARSVAVVARADNELECLRRGLLDAAKSAPFRDLAPGETIKLKCERRS